MAAVESEAVLVARLAEVNAAISTILTGAQHVGHGTRSTRFAELEQLQTLQRETREQLAAVQLGPMKARRYP